MCRHIAQRRTPNVLAPLYPEGRFNHIDVLPEGEELGPGQALATVHATASGPTFATTRWGLTISWARPNQPLLHARAETATTKPTFRDATRAHRAVILCEGWTKWCTTRGPRQRYWARRPGANAPVHIAALTWGAPGTVNATCVLVTAAASPSMTRIHHRPPLCLEDDELFAWLEPTTALGELEMILAAGTRREPRLTIEHVGGPAPEGRRTVKTTIARPNLPPQAPHDEPYSCEDPPLAVERTTTSNGNNVPTGETPGATLPHQLDHLRADKKVTVPPMFNSAPRRHIPGRRPFPRVLEGSYSLLSRPATPI